MRGLAEVIIIIKLYPNLKYANSYKIYYKTRNNQLLASKLVHLKYQKQYTLHSLYLPFHYSNSYQMHPQQKTRLQKIM